MKKVLVTGADGFIGSHLTESLLEKGYDVKAFTFYNSFNTWGWLDTLPKEKLREIEIFSGDVRDPNGVREAMTGVDAAHCDPVQLPFTGFLCGYQHQGHFKRVAGGKNAGNRARAHHIHIGSLRNGTVCPDR